jgi:hypothetical protein
MRAQGADAICPSCAQEQAQADGECGGFSLDDGSRQPPVLQAPPGTHVASALA